jgi:hypothetical protein
VDLRSGVVHRHHIFEDRLQRANKRAAPLAVNVKPMTVLIMFHSVATHLLQLGTESAQSKR